MKTTTYALCGAFLAVLASGCSKTNTPKSDGGVDDAGADAAAPAERPRPEGPVADVSEEITGGNGPFIGAASGLSEPDGYVDHEYVAAGTATAYSASGALTDDGKWTLVPSTSAAYRTRVLVRRPTSAAHASGTVLVEWLNVSGGADANPDYASLEEEILRQGHTWVGVSAQLIGVEGGPVLVSVPGASDLAGKGLKAIDPARYGSLVHPGDGYSFDIFTQVARALLEGGDILGGSKPKALIAVGESQSAFALTTYYDGVQPLTQAFDGFFVHSRGAASLPLVAPGASADLAGSIGSSTHPILRDDVDAPVLDLQTEGDLTGLLNSSVVRQPDTDRFRLWEVAGTSHADAHLVGPLAGTIDCGVPINDGPLHIVAKAAFNALNTWVRKATLPVAAPRIEMGEDGGTAVVERDEDGIALGGIRTPPVDVPVEALSGAPGPSSDVICLLLGSAKPFSAARLAELYPSRADYQQKYQAATDRTIQAGFTLEADRDALLGFAQPSKISP
ncbi:MAG TPA: alpha/beta hydrolase domain-containing protein [Polyangiaceae bacterium]|nr:alpha/beta hydrolase domain-containing protein [Polyangiaceae bacterium]